MPCQVRVTDSIRLGNSAPFLNKREFTVEGGRRWGWTEAEATLKWEGYTNTAGMPKGYDCQGWLSMPALEFFKQHAGRELAHDQHLDSRNTAGPGGGCVTSRFGICLKFEIDSPGASSATPATTTDHSPQQGQRQR